MLNVAKNDGSLGACISIDILESNMSKRVYFVNYLLYFLVPTVVVVGMFYNGALDCTNITTPYIVCIYFSMSNRYFGKVI